MSSYQKTTHAILLKRSTLRTALVKVFDEDKWKPYAVCYNCARDLTFDEIVKGFGLQSNEYVFCYCKCGKKVNPILVQFNDVARIELTFYGSKQVIAELKGKEKLSPENLTLRHPALYHSAKIHYGNLHKAFRKIGIKYQFNDPRDWRNKVKPFLGQLPDTVIAECISVHYSTICKLRKKIGIRSCNSKKWVNQEK